MGVDVSNFVHNQYKGCITDGEVESLRTIWQFLLPLGTSCESCTNLLAESPILFPEQLSNKAYYCHLHCKF